MNVDTATLRQLFKEAPQSAKLTKKHQRNQKCHFEAEGHNNP